MCQIIYQKYSVYAAKAYLHGEDGMLCLIEHPISTLLAQNYQRILLMHFNMPSKAHCKWDCGINTTILKAPFIWC